MSGYIYPVCVSGFIVCCVVIRYKVLVSGFSESLHNVTCLVKEHNMCIQSFVTWASHYLFAVGKVADITVEARVTSS